MTGIDDFKSWLKTYLLVLDKDFDTDVYTNYIYEILTNFTPNPSNQEEIIENLHSTLESLLPDIQISNSDEIFNQYLINVVNKEDIKEENDLQKTDILSEIIKKDKNAIDINKRCRPIDPRYALDYIGGDVCDKDDSFSDADIDEEFCQMRLESSNKIDDVLNTFDVEVNNKSSNVLKSAALNITKEFLMRKNNSDTEESDDSYNPISEEYGRANHEAVDREAQELRTKMKEKHQQKKEKDKLDRAKQKELVKTRKENEKKRTQKSERRR